MWFRYIRHNITLVYIIDGVVLTVLSSMLGVLIWLNLSELSTNVVQNLQDSTLKVQQTQVYFAQQQELSERILAQQQVFNRFMEMLDTLVLQPALSTITPQQIQSSSEALVVKSTLLLQAWPDTTQTELRNNYQQTIHHLTWQAETIHAAPVTDWNVMTHHLQQFMHTQVKPLLEQVDRVDEQLGQEARDILQKTVTSNRQNIQRMQHNLSTIKQGMLFGTILIICALLTSRVYFSVRFRRINRTAQQARAVAEQAVKTKARFLATMSHEIRTPMNGVIGMTRLLMNTPMSKKQTEFVESIHLSGEHLLTVINDVLDFSKLEAGKLDLKHEPLEIRACVEEVIGLLTSKALEKNLELAYAVGPSIPLYIEGDVVRLRQVLTNLLGNAVKFTDKGEVTVFVMLRSQYSNYYELEFQINDTGHGIPANQIDTVFEQFSRVDDTLSRRHEGTGLGLAISRRLVEMMGGKIWVESIVGVGSRFHFTIKTRRSDGALKKPFQHLNIPEISGKRILIVENNPATHQSLRDYCTAWGAIVETAVSANEANAWITVGKHYDIGLLESNLPNASALALAKYIRGRYNKQAFPLILIAPPNDAHPKDIVRELFNLYLTKPITRSRLFDSLMTVLGELSLVINKPETSHSKLGERLPLSILLVEDNQINQIVATSILDEMAYKVDVAENGVEAVSATRNKHYHVIFMDMQMPEMDGLEATRRIRAELAAEHQPIIIAMTANAMDGDKALCLAAGMNDYISKPVLPETVEAALQHWCKPITIRGNTHYATTES